MCAQLILPMASLCSLKSSTNSLFVVRTFFAFLDYPSIACCFSESNNSDYTVSSESNDGDFTVSSESSSDDFTFGFEDASFCSSKSSATSLFTHRTFFTFLDNFSIASCFFKSDDDDCTFSSESDDGDCVASSESGDLKTLP